MIEASGGELNTTGFITRGTSIKKKKKFSYIYTLSLDHFCLLIVKIRFYLCKTRGVEKLLNNEFGHKVEQPSSFLDVSRTLR